MSAESEKAQPVDLQIANAIQWLESDNHPHVADDLRDARAKVAALVDALSWYQQQCLAMDRTDWEGSKAKIALREDGGQRARNAMRSAGVL